MEGSERPCPPRTLVYVAALMWWHLVCKYHVLFPSAAKAVSGNGTVSEGRRDDVRLMLVTLRRDDTHLFTERIDSLNSTSHLVGARYGAEDAFFPGTASAVATLAMTEVFRCRGSTTLRAAFR